MATTKISFNGRAEFLHIQYTPNGQKTQSDKRYFGYTIEYDAQKRVVKQIILGYHIKGLRVHAIFIPVKNGLDGGITEIEVRVKEKLPSYFERLVGIF